MTQLGLGIVERLPEQDFGKDGRRAWFWQDGSWKVGRAWKIDANGRVVGMCRDYGPWGSDYGGRSPMETHGSWPQEEVSWKRPPEECTPPPIGRA